MIATSGQPKLMDFGIAAAGDNRGERRSEGTPTYMAPEQLAGADATTKSDIYALGLVMFEMLTGSRGVTAGTFDELVCAQENLASDISERLPRASPRLRQAIAQCLASDPAARPASAHEVSALLQTVVLDARATTRRWFQLVAQSGAVPLMAVGGGMVLRANGVDAIIGALMLLTVAVLVAIEIRYPLGWEAVYKGHASGSATIQSSASGSMSMVNWWIEVGSVAAGHCAVQSSGEQAPASASPRTSDRLPPSCHAGSSRNRSHLRRRPLCCLRHEMREFAE